MNEKLIEVLTAIDTKLSPVPFYSDWGLWNVVVLTITLVVLIFYTVYTYRLLIENKKIRESYFMPFLFISGQDFSLAMQPNSSSFRGRVSIVNIGKGPAVDVKIDNLEIGYFKIFFKNEISLIPHQSEFSMVTGRFDEMSSSGLKKLETPTQTPSNILRIRCKDQIGRQYVFSYDISNLNVSAKYVGYHAE